MSMSCVKLLNELEAYIEQSKKPLMGNKRTVDYDEIMAIVSAVRDSIPNDIKQAQFLLKNKDQIIGQAKGEADNAVNEAHREADIIVRDAQREARETVKQAQAMAEETIRTANEDAQIIVKEAKLAQLALIDQHQITKLATEQAKDTVEEAKRQSRELRIGGVEYVDSMLVKLESQFKKSLNEIRQNRSSLKN